MCWTVCSHKHQAHKGVLEHQSLLSLTTVSTVAVVTPNAGCPLLHPLTSHSLGSLLFAIVLWNEGKIVVLQVALSCPHSCGQQRSLVPSKTKLQPATRAPWGAGRNLIPEILEGGGGFSYTYLREVILDFLLVHLGNLADVILARDCI